MELMTPNLLSCFTHQIITVGSEGLVAKSNQPLCHLGIAVDNTYGLKSFAILRDGVAQVHEPTALRINGHPFSCRFFD